jgi:hypothetical protein
LEQWLNLFIIIQALDLLKENLVEKLGAQENRKVAPNVMAIAKRGVRSGVTPTDTIAARVSRLFLTYQRPQVEPILKVRFNL